MGKRSAEKDVGLIGDNDEGQEVGLKINNTFKKQYEQDMRQQELRKKEVKAALQSLSESEAESEEDSESDEDEDAELLTRGLDRQINETLIRIKQKDPTIYDSSAVFYNEDELADAPKKAKKEKKMDVKTVLANQLLTGEGDDSDAEDAATTTVELQRRARRALIENAAADDDVDDEFFARRGDASNPNEEDDEYAQFAAEQDRRNPSKEAEVLRQCWSTDPSQDLSKDELFLRNFVLNEWWKEENIDQVPKDCAHGHGANGFVAIEHESEDEAAVEDADRFEAKHNFRFEEDEGTRIQTHSRHVEGSLRRPDTRRAEARQRKSERKKEEKARQIEELKELKNVKKKQLKARLDVLRREAGVASLGIDDEDLDADFDPEAHDRKMEALFGDEFYDDDDIDEKMLKKTLAGSKSKAKDGKEEAKVPIEAESEEAKKDGRSQADVKAKEDAAVQEFIEDLYKMDYEDCIGGGDVKTRFRYVDVPSHDYGIDIVKLLSMDDSQLNSMVSLKKLAPYRTDRNLKMHWKQMQDTRNERHQNRFARQENDANKDSSRNRRRERRAREQELAGGLPPHKKMKTSSSSECTSKKVAKVVGAEATEAPQQKKRRRQKKKKATETSA